MSLSKTTTINLLLTNQKGRKSGSLMSLGNEAKSFLETLNMSTVISVVGGTSSVRDSQLEEFQGGGHDPKKRGFSLQSMELSIGGTVDDLFDAEAYMLFTEDEVAT